MFEFSIKDALDIFIVAALLYYIFRLMKESGTLSIFYGIMGFIVLWAVTSEVLGLKLFGSIMDKFMGMGLLILVILFQDQLKRFLVTLGSHKRWSFVRKMLRHGNNDAGVDIRRLTMPIIYACMAMSKSKTGALIVIQQTISLEMYEKTGDIIDSAINTRLIENIFFKNSPLHDGAMIISNHRIAAAGCILPVSHDTSIPRSLGLRHRSALGISQATDALAIVVSEETGNISVVHRGQLHVKISSTDLEQFLSQAFTNA